MFVVKVSAPGGRRNEALDCFVYALAALRISQQRFGLDLDQLERARVEPVPEPVRETRSESRSSAIVATDIPALTNWGTPYLFGPGSIHVAHRDDEFIEIEELRAAVDDYERIVHSVLP